MGATTRVLMSVEYVTDHDCGNYRIGEGEFSIKSAALDDYLSSYGYEGKCEIVKTLSYLIYEVEKRFRELPPRAGQSQNAAAAQ